MSFDLQPLLVLLVEDSEADVVLITEAFEDAKIAVELVVAKDGRVALDLLAEAERGERRLPELVLLDLNLPKIDGLEILEHIKSQPELKVIPVIVMTSSRSPADLHAAYEHHANSFIGKPIDPERFLTIMRGIEDYWVTIVRLPSRG
jgi:chemotaxis family two-component system response regulator Rcp1